MIAAQNSAGQHFLFCLDNVLVLQVNSFAFSLLIPLQPKPNMHLHMLYKF
jgi:hypothetical protein